MVTAGRLFLIPCTLGDTEPDQVIPGQTIARLLKLNEFIVEEIPTARRYLRKAGYAGDLGKIEFYVFNEHSQPDDIVPAINSLLSGHDIGLLSEAGSPCVADPGNIMVRMAHQHGIQVIPLTGPSSILLALMASGFNGQNFTFRGYLPIRTHERIRQIRLLEKTIYQLDQTQIFIEAPYRNLALFKDIIRTCSDDTYLCLACDLTLGTEWIRTQRIVNWKQGTPDIHKRPTVFLLYK